MITTRNIDELIPLRPVVFEMLLILNEGQRHGYGLMQDVQERTSGRWILGPGTLYRTLNEMQDSGLIEPAPGVEDKQSSKSKRDYRITGFGKKVASAEASRMLRLVNSAESGRLI